MKSIDFFQGGVSPDRLRVGFDFAPPRFKRESAVSE